jgi:hypothetical protein
MTTETVRPASLFYHVVVAINEPDLAMTAIYRYVKATNSMDASTQATEAAGREFGKPYRWTTESIELDR